MKEIQVWAYAHGDIFVTEFDDVEKAKEFAESEYNALHPIDKEKQHYEVVELNEDGDYDLIAEFGNDDVCVVL